MKSNIFIPKKINVGYQNRSGTYTGKLAYIIYYDEKGVLRKERSWNGWRDEDIPNDEFDNEPTEGFVLNKKPETILLVGIIDRRIVEYTTLGVLNSKSQLRICFIFWQMLIAIKEKVWKVNLYMDGVEKI